METLDIIFRRAEQSIRRELEPYLRSYDLHAADTLNVTLSDTWAADVTVTAIIMLSKVKVILQHNQAANRHEFDMIIPDQSLPVYSTITFDQAMMLSMDGRWDKDHPPYPLIGIEWEPQLTLLNYPKLPIEVFPDHFKALSCTQCYNNNTSSYKIALYVSPKYVDATNLEFRTKTVKIEDLPNSISIVQDKMEDLVKEIAKALGPTGIFLPALPCTKHVNISMPEWNDELF